MGKVQDRVAVVTGGGRVIAISSVEGKQATRASDAGAGITGALLNVDGGSSPW
jgi:hypothetical protein